MSKLSVKISKKVFNPVFLPYLDNTSRYEILYGGAGSGKSVFIAQKKIYQHLRDKGRNTLVLRKVARTNRHSTFALINQTISKWGLRKAFNVNKSDMIITCKNRNQIIFAGLDDVEKLKSITFETGNLTDVWIEEASEITEEDFEQIDLRLRGISKIPYQITLSFNPISALSWLKRRFFDFVMQEARVFKTTYLDNTFVDDAYRQKMQRLKDQNPTLYEIYALGNWGILGNLVYTNYSIHEFDTSESCYSSIYYGLDWGYNDPCALVKIGLKDQELYILDEMYITQKTNPELMKEARRIITAGQLVTADSSEPKSIKEWKQNGYHIRPAVKGPDSIKYGLDFVRRHKLHIHPKCQNYINEIQGYCYEKDKDGNVLESPVDFKNHLMDCTRYALESLARVSAIRALE